MRLLVVSGSEPYISFVLSPKRRIHAQPPGPGLPMQAPSVINWTCFMNAPSIIRSVTGTAGQKWQAGDLSHAWLAYSEGMRRGVLVAVLLVASAAAAWAFVESLEEA